MRTRTVTLVVTDETRARLDRFCEIMGIKRGEALERLLDVSEDEVLRAEEEQLTQRLAKIRERLAADIAETDKVALGLYNRVAKTVPPESAGL